jgi:hypothetical protein
MKMYLQFDLALDHNPPWFYCDHLPLLIVSICQLKKNDEIVSVYPASSLAFSS